MAGLMCIDGNSLTYRAFFALPTDMATASGQVTNAVYGFTSMLCNLVRDHHPEYLVVAFDLPVPTFRHERLESYKANRSSAPDILREQMGLVREVVDTLGIPVVEKPGFEADDVIATLAERARAVGIATIVVTGDRDSFQLVQDPHIAVLYNKRGVSDYVLYDERGIEDRTGVAASQYVDYAALRGDNSDNLPGVPGVGEKTAAKLINTYGDLDGVLAHAQDQSPKLRSNLETFADQARLNRELMTLIRDVPIPIEIDALKRRTVDEAAVLKLFSFLEFGSLRARFKEAFVQESEDSQPIAELHAEMTELAPESIDGWAMQLEELLVMPQWSGRPGTSSLVGLAVLHDPSDSSVGWIADPEHQRWSEQLPAFLASRPLVTHDAKPLLRRLLFLDWRLPEVAFDTKIGAYLLDPADPRYSLDELVSRYTEYELSQPEQQAQLSFDGEADECSQYLGREVLAVAALSSVIRSGLDAQGLIELFHSVEVPLIHVLAEMEAAGVAIDVPGLRQLGSELTERCEQLRAQIVEEAGVEFNVNSTKQLGEVLFERMGLTPQKKTKTGYSTDASTLEKMRGEHPVIEMILSYRESEKLRGTYAEGLLSEVQSDGRIHATFNQTVARTGRLSSEYPNLHNVPIRSEAGAQFRRVFVAPSGGLLLVADYNQIELRCIAHLAQDPGLIAAFTTGTDVHTETAARIFGVAPDAVNSMQRAKAKMVSYGLAYGMEAYGLSQRLNIPVPEAKSILDAYFVAFPRVGAYMEETVDLARQRGYTETLFGRRRRIPELASGVRSVRMAGERQAMNAGIQGLAADIFKVALIRVHDRLGRDFPDARLILQVHDEVVCEVPESEIAAAAAAVESEMRDAFEMSVPLAVNVAWGATWAAAKQ